MTLNSPRAARWALVALLLAALLLYWLTLDNGLRPGELAGGDLITHQYAQVQGRPSNAPGYPLYTMGGWLWFHGLRPLLSPFANPTAILSTYSTLWALLALALLYRLIFENTANWPASLLASAFYAVTYFFWYYAASTEQYTSAVAQTLAIVLLAFRWEAPAGRTGDLATARRTDRLLLALAFLCGLSLAHLVTVAFIVPPLLWFILSRGRPDLLRRPRLVTQAIGLALLPLLSYAFVYIRGAQHPEWRGAGQWPDAWAWFWSFLSTRQGRDELTWRLQPLWTAQFPGLIWQELTWIVLLGGLAGLLLLGRRRGLFLAGTLLIYLAFSFVDRLGNWYQVIMPAYALLVFSFAAAVDWLWRRLAKAGRSGSARRLIPGALAGGLILLIGLRLAWSLPQADQRDRPADTGLLAGQAILADEPATNAAVLGTFTETLSLRYLTEIWQERPDVAAVSSETAGQLLASGQRPVYASGNALPIVWSEVSPDARLSSAGATLIAVRPQPVTSLPPGVEPLDRPVGDGLRLAGYEARLAPGTLLHLRLFWQGGDSVGHDWSVSLRPTQAGQLIALPQGGIVQADLPHPVHGMYPMTSWLPGEIVADDYFVALPAGQSADGVQVVVYRPVEGGFDNLAVFDLPLR